MDHLPRDSLDRTSSNHDEHFYGPIPVEYHFEKPAIDRLLDYLSYQESQKAAIDILIQEYLERVNSPSVHFYTTKYEEENKSIENQTTPRTVLYNGNIASIFPTPNTSSNDVSYDPNYEFRNSASTPLLPPLTTRAYRSSSVATDGLASTPSTRVSISSNPDLPSVERYTSTNSNQDYRLKQAAAQERRQATRHFGRVQPGLIWTSPLPVRPRTFSIRPPSLSCKIFLGGIPHDLNQRDLQERLESFGPVRLEWPNKDHITMQRNSNNMMAGFVYAIYENDESVYQILHTCSTKVDRTLDDGRCEYYLEVHSQRQSSRRKSIQIIPWFVEDSQWSNENDYSTAHGYATWEQRLGSTECINRTVFVGALHGMMTAYALAKICQELFGDVEYAAIDTDRNKYPIGSGRVVFVNAHSYYAAVTANYLMIDCDKFCKVIQIDPYLSDSVNCAGTSASGQWCPNIGQYFCRSLKCMKYYCATCWDLNPHHQVTQVNECEPPAMVHKPLMRNARMA